MSSEANTHEPTTQTESQETQDNTIAEATSTSETTPSAFGNIFEPLTPKFDREQAIKFIHDLHLRPRCRFVRIKEDQNGNVHFFCEVARSSFSAESATEKVLLSMKRGGKDITVDIDGKGNHHFQTEEEDCTDGGRKFTRTIIMFTEFGVKNQAALLSRDLRYSPSELIAEAILIRRATKAMRWLRDDDIKDGANLFSRVNLFTRTAVLVSHGDSEHNHSSKKLDKLERTAESIEYFFPNALKECIAALEEALSLLQAGAEEAATKVETAKANLIQLVAKAIRSDFAMRRSLFNLVRALHKVGLVEKADIKVFAPYIPDLARLVPDLSSKKTSDRKAGKPTASSGSSPAKKGKKKGKGGKKPAQPAQPSTSNTMDNNVVSPDVTPDQPDDKVVSLDF